MALMCISDPTRDFMAEEWEALQYNGGHAYVIQAHSQINCTAGRGHGIGNTGGYGGRGNAGHNVGAVSTINQGYSTDNTQQDMQEDGGGGHDNVRGGQNGRGFGCGAYGGG